MAKVITVELKKRDKDCGEDLARVLADREIIEFLTSKEGIKLRKEYAMNQAITNDGKVANGPLYFVESAGVLILDFIRNFPGLIVYAFTGKEDLFEKIAGKYSVKQALASKKKNEKALIRKDVMLSDSLLPGMIAIDAKLALIRKINPNAKLADVADYNLMVDGCVVENVTYGNIDSVKSTLALFDSISNMPVYEYDPNRYPEMIEKIDLMNKKSDLEQIRQEHEGLQAASIAADRSILQALQRDSDEDILTAFIREQIQEENFDVNHLIEILKTQTLTLNANSKKVNEVMTRFIDSLDANLGKEKLLEMEVIRHQETVDANNATMDEGCDGYCVAQNRFNAKRLAYRRKYYPQSTDES